MNVNQNNKKRKSSADDEPLGTAHVRGLEEELLETKKRLVETEKDLADAMVRIKDFESKAGPKEDEGFSDDDDESVDDANPWVIKFKELREHRIVNGNCIVSQKGPNSSLGNWILNQKKAHKSKKLTPVRVAKLDSLGLVWGKAYPQPVSWATRLEELSKFAKAFGHCNMTINATSPSEIAKWISTQRVEYRCMKKGKGSLLSLEQIGQLNEIAFNWKGPRLS